MTLVESVPLLLCLTVAASAADSGTQTNVLGLGTTTLLVSKDSIKDIMKKVKYL